MVLSRLPRTGAEGVPQLDVSGEPRPFRKNRALVGSPPLALAEVKVKRTAATPEVRTNAATSKVDSLFSFLVPNACKHQKITREST
jgi:hypothetical protein